MGKSESVGMKKLVDVVMAHLERVRDVILAEQESHKRQAMIRHVMKRVAELHSLWSLDHNQLNAFENRLLLEMIKDNLIINFPDITR